MPKRSRTSGPGRRPPKGKAKAIAKNPFAALLTAVRRDVDARLAGYLDEHLAAAIEEMLAIAAAHAPVQGAILSGLTYSPDAKKPRIAWLEKEPAEFARLRSAKEFAALDARLVWPGKPGAPEPPKIVPLTPEQTARAEKGRTVFNTLCAACHQPHGFGLDGLAPPLVDSEWLVGKADIPARIIMHGMAGQVKVGSRTWNLAMPPLPQLTDEDIAGVLTFLRREWEHNASPVEPAEITALRAKYKDRALPWSAAELKGGKK